MPTSLETQTLATIHELRRKRNPTYRERPIPMSQFLRVRDAIASGKEPRL